MVYTFSSFIDPAFVSPRKGAYRALDRVEAIDPLHRRFSLKEPFGSFPIQLVMPVVPDGRRAGAARRIRSAPGRTGSSSFAVDDQVELAAFADYFGGAPRNAGVVLKVVPDEIMRGLELRKGTVDVVVNDLSPDIVHQLAEEKAVTIAESPGTDYAYVGFNMRDPVLSGPARAPRASATRSIARRSSITCGAAWRVRRSASCRRRRGRSSRRLPVHARSGEGARRCSTKPAIAIPTATVRQPRLRLTLKVSTNEFIRLQAAVIQQDLQAGRHRARRARRTSSRRSTPTC